MADYPNLPSVYRDYIIEGITKAESELESEKDKSVWPQTFRPEDNIPGEIVEAVMYMESRFDPRAHNPDYCNNQGGNAWGLGQFCMNPGGDPGGSMELSDYQALTGKRVTMSDVMNPKEAIHLMAFGLGDRYTRLKSDDKSRPDWFMSVAGYSPITDEQISAYTGEMKKYIAAKYGEDRVKEIEQGNKGSSSGGTLQDCSKYPKWNPSYWVCQASNAGVKGNQKIFGGRNLIGTTDEEINQTFEDKAKDLLSAGGGKYLAFVAGGLIVVMGIVIMAGKRAPIVQALT